MRSSLARAEYLKVAVGVTSKELTVCCAHDPRAAATASLRVVGASVLVGATAKADRVRPNIFLCMLAHYVECRFFRTICGWFSAVLCLRHELSTAAVGRFVASADRPPPWTTLRCVVRCVPAVKPRRSGQHRRLSWRQSDGFAMCGLGPPR